MIIAFEGLDGSGKSTQIKLLTSYLEKKGFRVVISDWRRSKEIVKLVKRISESKNSIKRDGILVFVAEYWKYMDIHKEHMKEQNTIYIFDRYVYTEIVRALSRGIDSAWINEMYKGAVVPDITFFLECSLEKICDRKKDSKLSFFEAGLDCDVLEYDSYYEIYNKYKNHNIDKNDILHQFLIFQNSLKLQYTQLNEYSSFQIIDTSNISEQEIHESIKGIIEDYFKANK